MSTFAASQHNLDNDGSWTTEWIECVAACQKWLYQMHSKDMEEVETPASSSTWKKACQNMYTASNKVRLCQMISGL